MRLLLHRFLAKFEPYRIRHGYGLSPLRNKCEVRALLGFCREQLQDVELMKLNPKLAHVYKETVRLADEDEYSEIEFYDFVNEHINYYWD